MLTILSGLPGAGKTTLAEELRALMPEETVIIARDPLRAMFFGERITYPEDEKFITEEMLELADRAVLAGKSVVIDDMNLDAATLREWQEFQSFCEVKFIHISTSPEECIRRDALRARPVGEQVIVDMAKTFSIPFEGEEQIITV